MTVDPPRPVDVLHDGRRLPGTLLAARRDEYGHWLGLVTQRDRRVALSWYHWRPAADLRRSVSEVMPDVDE
jgi:hypothetical protein